MLRERAGAGADADDDLAAVHFDRRLKGFDEVRAGCFDVREGECVVADQRELIATEACCESRALRDVLQPFGDPDQHCIPECMPDAVVDVLEVVDVQEEDADHAIRLLGLGNRVGQQGE